MARLTLQNAVLSLVAQPHLAVQAAPFQNGDILHTNFYRPHVRIDSHLKRALEANQSVVDQVLQTAARQESPPVSAPQPKPELPQQQPRQLPGASTQSVGTPPPHLPPGLFAAHGQQGSPTTVAAASLLHTARQQQKIPRQQPAMPRDIGAHHGQAGRTSEFFGLRTRGPDSSTPLQSAPSPMNPAMVASSGGRLGVDGSGYPCACVTPYTLPYALSAQASMPTAPSCASSLHGWPNGQLPAFPSAMAPACDSSLHGWSNGLQLPARPSNMAPAASTPHAGTASTQHAPNRRPAADASDAPDQPQTLVLPDESEDAEGPVESQIERKTQGGRGGPRVHRQRSGRRGGG